MPAARLITDRSAKTTSELLTEKIDRSNREIVYLSWGRRHDSEIKTNSNLLQLDYFRSISSQYQSNIKVRIEEPYLTLYSDDEQLLYNIAIGDPSARTREIHRPVNDEAKAVLNRGEIIVSPHIAYNYKITLSEGYSHNAISRKQIYEYLISLGDDVKLTKGCVHLLTSSQLFWCASSYFYAQDDGIQVFIKLIDPGAISGICKLTVL